MTMSESKTSADILRAAHEWHTKLTELDVGDEERRAFAAWRDSDPRHEELYDRAVTLHHALGTLQSEDLDAALLAPTRREIWVRFKARCADRLKVRTTKEERWGAVAYGATGLFAALCFGVVAFVALDGGFGGAPDATFNYRTALGETRAITLSDGSTLTLGAASEVTTRFDASERRAEVISGSAYFEVSSEPDRPFYVEAGDLHARVVGTVFDVTRAGEITRVAVAEGEVEVSYPVLIEKQRSSFRGTASLTVGQRIAASPESGLGAVSAIDLSSVGAWRNDRLFYDGALLSEMVADANRYSKDTVVIEGDYDRIAAFRVRGSFNARDIDGMLSTLPVIYPLELDRSRPGFLRIVLREDPAP